MSALSTQICGESVVTLAHEVLAKQWIFDLPFTKHPDERLMDNDEISGTALDNECWAIERLAEKYGVEDDLPWLVPFDHLDMSRVKKIKETKKQRAPKPFFS